MARTYEEVIKEHILTLEEDGKTKITKFYVDYNPGCDPEELAKELSKMRASEKLFGQIDALTIAEAKISHYEEILRKIRKFGQSKVTDWLDMPETERKLRSELFALTDMGMFASMQYYIDFAKKKGILF